MNRPGSIEDVSRSLSTQEPAASTVQGSPRVTFLAAMNSLSWLRFRQAGFSVADQVLSVGGMFLVNVALARTQSKEEYGIFALSYSVFTFLSGVHNAAILETYTVYGSGRYQKHFPSYASLLWRINILWGLGLTVALALFWRVVAWAVPAMASITFLGMAITCGVLLTAAFIRRTFYIRRRSDLAAKFSAIFFFCCFILLWTSIRTGILNGFFAFVIVSLAWMFAASLVQKELPRTESEQSFVELEPVYWSEHWKYSRWVLVTAFVFQLTTQGYLWLAAAFLSVKEVGNLRAMYNVVLPADQLFTAMSLLVLPVMCSRYTTQKMTGLLGIWKTYCLGWSLISLNFAFLVYVFGRRLMHLLYSGRFDDVAGLVCTLAFLPVIMGVGHTINGALKAAEKPNLVFYAYVFSGGTTFAIGIPLIIHLGLRGAVYGMLISGAAYTAALGVGLYSILVSGKLQVAPDATAP